MEVTEISEMQTGFGSKASIEASAVNIYLPLLMASSAAKGEAVYLVDQEGNAVVRLGEGILFRQFIEELDPLKKERIRYLAIKSSEKIIIFSCDLSHPCKASQQ